MYEFSTITSVGHQSSVCNNEYIDSDSFSSTCMSMEGVDFDAVVKLLDQDRKRRLLERIFTPLNFKMEKAKIPGLSPLPSSISAESTSSLPSGVSISKQTGSKWTLSL